eukprot:CAMPEP_0117082300 /NCGR_PEP_ID=MMETSP0472-20121206/57967_1 /TAXON_ID=693140 ORGANISM="Tiarina fusus, Strain LIS" /NCGR_SAMPLE_ID=MMETSP0472 /ASSEMBLY_ACC=CAM_ASM_000603 /LENGTH=203 /DNA_ID=CAMNT_0004810505 /DNA_START=17 /DNA_END=624 /DNA_ORIENTATION=-
MKGTQMIPGFDALTHLFSLAIWLQQQVQHCSLNWQDSPLPSPFAGSRFGLLLLQTPGLRLLGHVCKGIIVGTEDTEGSTDKDGPDEGIPEGLVDTDGPADGRADGTRESDGLGDGSEEGKTDRDGIDDNDGPVDGRLLGVDDGFVSVGEDDTDGLFEGLVDVDGVEEGPDEGIDDGGEDGSDEGTNDGTNEGVTDGPDDVEGG